MTTGSSILPLADRWYQRLLVLALVMGVAAGIAAVVYMEFTGAGTSFFFGDPTDEVFGGEWWWIPLLAGGAVLVVLLRQVTGQTEDIPGAVAYARRGWVEPSSALPLFALSALSLFVGASLGPSFGIIVSGGGLGAWLSQRRSVDDTEGQHEYVLTGMAGGLSAVFAGPLIGSVMAGELSTSPKSRYVALFIPMFMASVVGWLVYVSAGGVGLFGAYSMTGYEFENIHLLYGLLLGLFAIVVLFAQALIGNGIRWVSGRIPSPVVRALVLGAVVGFVAFALPLTATGGSAQLAFETSNISSLSVGLLLAVLVGKIAAFVASQEAGFLGGPVFPTVFIGGTAGIVVSLLFTGIPAPLAVAAMIAAVPGATLAAPVSFILLGGGVVALGIDALPPIGVAVITAHLAVWGLQIFRDMRHSM